MHNNVLHKTVQVTVDSDVPTGGNTCWKLHQRSALVFVASQSTFAKVARLGTSSVTCCGGRQLAAAKRSFSLLPSTAPLLSTPTRLNTSTQLCIWCPLKSDGQRAQFTTTMSRFLVNQTCFVKSLRLNRTFVDEMSSIFAPPVSKLTVSKQQR